MNRVMYNMMAQTLADGIIVMLEKSRKGNDTCSLIVGNSCDAATFSTRYYLQEEAIVPGTSVIQPLPARAVFFDTAADSPDDVTLTFEPDVTKVGTQDVEVATFKNFQFTTDAMTSLTLYAGAWLINGELYKPQEKE